MWAHEQSKSMTTQTITDIKRAGAVDALKREAASRIDEARDKLAFAESSLQSLRRIDFICKAKMLIDEALVLYYEIDKQ